MIALYKGTSALSRLIRWRTWSEYSHAAWVFPDGSVIEAWKGGVTHAPSILAGHVPDTEVHLFTLDLTADQRWAIQDFLIAQIGKPYDYTAILGLGLRRDWQEEDAWFCSELVAWAFQHAGEPLFRAECLRRVTPQHLWMLAPAPPPPDPALLAPIEGRLVRPSSF